MGSDIGCFEGVDSDRERNFGGWCMWSIRARLFKIWMKKSSYDLPRCH